MILLDTDHFSVVVDARDASHADWLINCGMLTTLSLPIVAVEEQLRAWLAQVRRIHDVTKQVYPYDRLIRLVDTLSQWDIARWNESAAEIFIGLALRAHSHWYAGPEDRINCLAHGRNTSVGQPS